MKRTVTSLVAMIAVIAVSLTACGDDDPTGLDALTTEQARAMALTIFSQAWVTTATIPLEPAAQASSPLAVDYNEQVSLNVPCPLGGSLGIDATVVGTVDDQTGAADLTYTVTQSYADCALQGNTGSFTFTLNGDPGINHTAEISTDGSGGGTLAGTLSGSPAWETEDRSGTCPVSMTYTGSGSGTGTGSFSVSGTVCGVDFSREIQIGSS